MRVVETVVRNIVCDNARSTHSGDVTFTVVHDSGVSQEIGLQVTVPADTKVPFDKVHIAIMARAADKLRQLHGNYHAGAVGKC